MRRARILLVDDNPVNRKLMAAVLSAEGYRVDEARSGREALEGCRLLPYDLVLMDIQMEDMDGLAAAAAIRALDGPRGEVPIVAISGESDDEVGMRCASAGMNAHLPKPVSPVLLSEVVRRWAQGRQAARTSAAPAVASAERLGGLAADLSDAALAPILDEFISGSALRMAAIEKAAASRDLDRLRGIAHDLSGSAANLGFMDLSRVARSVESACIEAAPDVVDRLLPETRVALREALATLAARRGAAAELR